jgi:hypothetical protein
MSPTATCLRNTPPASQALVWIRYSKFQESPGMMRFINSSKSGTVKAESVKKSGVGNRLDSDGEFCLMAV